MFSHAFFSRVSVAFQQGIYNVQMFRYGSFNPAGNFSFEIQRPEYLALQRAQPFCQTAIAGGLSN